jgi:peptide/nickel transport system substrate-binding protein
MEKLMRHLPRGLVYFLLPLFFIAAGCKKNGAAENNSVVIAISSDIERINPLYSFSLNEANINELLFLSLVRHSWDEKSGDLVTEPMIAKEWKWEKDSSAIFIKLRNDINWSDGKKLTADDVIFSFDLYSDPLVESYLYGTFKNFYADKENHIDVLKTFEKRSDYEVKINFIPGSRPSLYCLDFPVIPKHIFEKIDRKNLVNSELNFTPVSSGPFMFEKWDKNNVIVLKKNYSSPFSTEGNIGKIYFKIIPEYSSRLTQLKNGEIDLMEDVKAGDAKELSANKAFTIIPVKGREYDYIGWNNIDPVIYQKTQKTVPHPILGNSLVRRALTLSINRNEILKEYLGGYGQIANSPIAPIFKNAVNSTLKPYAFNIDSAKKLLAEAGWKDVNKDGVLEKNGKPFKLNIAITASKPRRALAAALIKNTYKQAGIDLNVEQVEGSVFAEKLGARAFDAWMAGWFVPIPLDLKISWYGDLKKTPMNLCGFRDNRADRLLDEIENTSSASKKNSLYRELEELLYSEQPVSFLYWVDNIVACNSSIKNIEVNPLGVVHHCWKWTKK